MVELEPSVNSADASSSSTDVLKPAAVLKPACCTPLSSSSSSANVRIRTDSPAVLASVRGTLALLRRNHPEACMTCQADGRCEFQDLVQRYEVPLLLPKAPHLERRRAAVGTGAANAAAAADAADPRAAASPQPGGGPAAAVGRDSWLPYDASSTAIALDADKCILCGRCVDVCSEQQGMDVLAFYGRGQDRHLGFAASDAAHSHCISCGQCVASCPVGALSEKTEWREVLGLLQQQRREPAQTTPRGGGVGGVGGSPSSSSSSPSRAYATAASLPSPRHSPSRRRPVMVAQTAPSVRVALAEEVGLAPGTVTTGQMVAALRALGFDVVFDTDWSADLTIMEEGNELLTRLAEAWAREAEEGVGTAAAAAAQAAPSHAPAPPLPMFTSCCPAWVHLVEADYPSLIPHLSSCKSPQQMLAAVIKKVWWPRERARRRRESEQRAGGQDEEEDGDAEEAERCVHVSIMPCVAKKDEARRPQVRGDVDYVLTTRELGRMLRLQRVPVASLPSEGAESRYDDPLGAGTGAGVLFGASGGVMEAALRTVAELATGEPLPLDGGRLSFQPVDAPFARAPARSPYNPTTLSGHTQGGGELLEATLELPVAAILRLGLKGEAGKQRAERAIAALPPRKQVRVAVANGIAAARRLLDAHFTALRSGQPGTASPLSRYHFFEAMACVGGCVNGGGQPKAPAPRPGHPETAWASVVAARTAAIHALDEAAPVRRSHANPSVRAFYGMDDEVEEQEGGKEEAPPTATARVRGGVGGHDAHALLHTTYGPLLAGGDGDGGGGGGGVAAPPYSSEQRARTT
jgi:iron only hydrogenase large subunit-like protein